MNAKKTDYDKLMQSQIEELGGKKEKLRRPS